MRHDVADLPSTITSHCRHHPHAAITCSTEFFNATGRDQFFAALSKPSTSEWLTGVVYGKEAELPLTQFVERYGARFCV
jgi:hypothetical protein